MKFLIHASDLSNGVMAFPNYLRWSVLLMQEFNYQVECEQANNLTPTSFMKYSNKAAFYKGQIFFLCKFN